MRIIQFYRRTALAMMSLALLILLALAAGRTSPAIYWGARISGDTYGYADAPWDLRSIEQFTQHTQKQPSIISWGQPWWFCYSTCGYQRFSDQLAQYEAVRSHGHIPLIDWASWDYSITPQHNQPQFMLQMITSGKHDDYIRQWASEARDWGHPFFLRFDWEMNGNWFPWSEQRNGNSDGEYIRAWRHVHDIFTAVGASNVTWVWCPNIVSADSLPVERFYPGDAYVDWMCVDGYNWGENPARPDHWQSFAEIFGPTYTAMTTLSPNKPIIIAETASTEYGGSKAAWITDVLTKQLPGRFPAIKALIWFNWNVGGMDWQIESSPDAQRAFADGIRSRYYAQNEFTNLPNGPIAPLNQVRGFCLFMWCTYP
jgi:hypothetical protein